jgi:hypothetical protein
MDLLFALKDLEMTLRVVDSSVRSCAQDLVEVIDAFGHHQNADKLREGLLTIPFLRWPNLFDFG